MQKQCWATGGGVGSYLNSLPKSWVPAGTTLLTLLTLNSPERPFKILCYAKENTGLLFRHI